jgi:hypothetical protein
MAARTVRLDDEDELLLDAITRKTGMSISATLKKGLVVLNDQIEQAAKPTPYEIFRHLDLGEGGYAIAPATEVDRGMQEALRRKLNR